MLTAVALFVLAALLVQFWTGLSRAVKKTVKGLQSKVGLVLVHLIILLHLRALICMWALIGM